MELNVVNGGSQVAVAPATPSRARGWARGSRCLIHAGAASMWTEKFCSMAAVLATRFPEKGPEFFAYLASILRAERNFDDGRWVAYDRCYRREALAQKNLDWSVPNARLYNEAFTGRARAVPRCSYCLQEDHVSQSCPRNPNRPWFGWLPQGPDNRGAGPSRPPPPRGQLSAL